jgi:signal transduction histidine kinase
MSIADAGYVKNDRARHLWAIERRAVIGKILGLSASEATLVKDPDFDDKERLLMIEVAQRLEPRLGDIVRDWTNAIPLAAPPDKIAAMRRTLAALGEEFGGAFFRSLISGGPQQALAAHDQFCERLIRSRPFDAVLDQRLTITDLMRAARLFRAVVDREIARLFDREDSRQAESRYAYARLWNLASDALALTYCRIYEEQVRLRQDELSAARDAALEGSRLKSAFLANITHEIRTPLNVIIGYADLIAERMAEIGDESGSEYTEPIRRAGQRLLDTIGAVLDLSRIESGAFEVQPVQIKLADMVERQVKDLGVLARKKGIALVCEIGEPDATVLFDEHCLSNTIINLLHNAIKFTDRGTVSVRVFRDRTGALALEVRDTGEGIDAAYLPHLFEPFSQEGQESPRGHNGAGLGLALVRHYVELNHARIGVESAKHEGTAFTINFAREAAGRAAN